SRTVYPTVPPQVEYALTDLGYSLSEPLRALGAWAGKHLELIDENRLRYDRAVSAERGRGAA
ncbi:transcriptional regulator, partial [Pseudomonas sp. FW305-130]